MVRSGVAICIVILLRWGEAQAAEPPPAEPLPLSLQEAVRLALENNVEVAVESKNRIIRGQELLVERGRFDPELRLNLDDGKSVTPPSVSVIESAFFNAPNESERLDLDLSLRQRLSTGGDYTLNWTNSRAESNFQAVNPSYSSNVTMSVNQPLLKAAGPGVARSAIRIAQNNRTISEEAFALKVMDLVRDVHQQYWDLAFQRENLKVQEQKRDTARQLADVNRAKVSQGLLAPIEILVAEAEVAAREEAVVTAEKAVHDAEDRLRRTLNLERDSLLYDLTILPTDRPEVSERSFDLEETYRTALERRPDLRQARVSLENARIALQVAQNGRRPALDFQGSAGLNGLGPDPGQDLDRVRSGDFYSWKAGLVFSIPLGGRTPRGEAGRRRAESEKAEVETRRLEQLAAVEVREAIRSVETDRKRVEATGKASFLAEKKLEAQNERFRLNLVSTKDLLESQRDLATARANGLLAITDYNTSLARLARAKGTILDEAGIELAPR